MLDEGERLAMNYVTNVFTGIFFSKIPYIWFYMLAVKVKYYNTGKLTKFPSIF